LLAQELGMKVIVEGVETEAQLKAIKEIGADEVQGFLLGHPTPNPLKHLSTYPSAMVENAMDEATFLVPELEVP
jgi:EAL domain-containing protein (putative c-di-GMP-specific phosphodiesterase class I)